MNPEVACDGKMRWIKWALLLNLLLSFNGLSGQHLSIDSLQATTSPSSPDSTRVIFLCELSKKFLTYRPPLSKQYAEEALALSQKIGFKRGEMLALNRLGECEFRLSNYAKSVEQSIQSLKLAEELHDSLAMAAVYRILGNTYSFGLKLYEKALQYQLLALNVYSKKKDFRNVASLYGNITWLYANTHQNLNEAYAMAKRGARLADSLNNDQLLSYNYNSLGLIFMNLKQPDSALFYLDKSTDIGTRMMDRSLNAYNNTIKGKIHLQQLDFLKAQQFLHLAERESRELNSREVLKESFDGLARTYEGLGNFPLAYQYQKKFMELKDSLINWEITQKALMVDYEQGRQQREAKIAELEQLATRERSEKKTYTLLLGIGISSLLIIIFLIIRNNTQRRKANELLLEKNREIQLQNEQLRQVNEIKDKLFFIVGHDMRGPLANLKALLGMLARKEVSEQEFKMLTPQLNQQVIGINETIENLLKWSGSQLHGWQLNPTTFSLYPVIEKSFSLFAESALRKGILMTNTIDHDLHVHADQDQIELVIRNLLHNAIKFTPEGGQINVSAFMAGEFVQIEFTDTGVGFSEEQLTTLFEESGIRNTRGTKGERGTGLGLTLCYDMIKANHGSIRISSVKNKGTTVYVQLKAAKT